MKLLYFVNSKEIASIGIIRKISQQIDVFKENGYDVYKTDDSYFKKNLLKKFLNRFPFYWHINYKKMYVDYKDVDAIYIRRSINNWKFIQFLSKFKKNNPNIKIFYEIPTYPYDPEDKINIFSFHNILKDRINRKKLHKYVDRIITFSRDEYIFNTPTISTINGINVQRIRKRIVNKNNMRAINIITVSGFAYWHGIDRFIKGLGEYYKNGGKRKVIFHVVGYGTANDFDMYHDMVKEYNLQDVVILYGRKDGAELDDIYDKANLALGSLGLHRIDPGLIASTLKTREFVAKGLPVVASGKVDIFDEKYSFYLELPADESPINIKKAIEYYDKIYPTEESFQKINDKIREFAEKTVDMKITMRPVIDYLKGVEK